ncbi:MAG: G5 domain-containing protein [Parcubacteria group bacterium]
MKKIFIILILTAAFWAIYYFFASRPGRELILDNSAKSLCVNDNGLFFNVTTSASTLSDFVKEKNIKLAEHDKIIPALDSSLLPGMNITMKRALKIKIMADGKTSDAHTLENSVAGALWENNIKLGEDDFTKPALDKPLQNNATIEVIRVDIKEEIVKKDIPFKTTSNEDDELSWRTKKITQRGERGIKEITYKIVSHNNKEISRKVLKETVTKEPVTEVVTQGTYVKIGKIHTGVASWYAYTGTMAAANPWLPMGSYVRVTNTENGKSVIVKINDRGPFGNGRIIDLDKVAFAKIANLGAGVANVKMEVIVN